MSRSTTRTFGVQRGIQPSATSAYGARRKPRAAEPDPGHACVTETLRPNVELLTKIGRIVQAVEAAGTSAAAAFEPEVRRWVRHMEQFGFLESRSQEGGKR